MDMETISDVSSSSTSIPHEANREQSRPEFFLHMIKSATASPDDPPAEPFINKNPGESFEIKVACQKFQEISECIDNEEKHLKSLEERRQKLEKDMERLQQDIETEKELFRQKVESDLARKRQTESEQEHSSDDEIAGFSRIDPLSINTEEVEDRIREYREAVEDSQLQSILHEDDADINRFRQNLVAYKKVLQETKNEKVVKQKRKAAAKIFQRHLSEVDSKCNEQLNKLTDIQKSIGNINAAGHSGFTEDVTQ